MLKILHHYKRVVFSECVISNICWLLTIELVTNLFECAFHGLVNKQSHWAHQVADKNKVTFGLDVQSNDVVCMVTLHTQLFLSSPLKQSNLHVSCKLPVQYQPRWHNTMHARLGRLHNIYWYRLPLAQGGGEFIYLLRKSYQCTQKIMQKTQKRRKNIHTVHNCSYR